MSDPASTFENAPDVPLPRLVNFVKQVAHDVRNGLNAIDLQTAFLAEIGGEGEVGQELAKLRKMVCHVAADMQELTARFGELKPVIMEYPVEEFLLGVKEEVEEEFETQAKRIVWEVKLGAEEVEMDYSLLKSALLELIRNAIYFREGDQAIHFKAWIEKGRLVFEVSQSRTKPVTNADQWGRVPLISGRRGGYGLGLFYVRRILDTLGGVLEPVYDAKSGELRMRLILPSRSKGTPVS